MVQMTSFELNGIATLIQELHRVIRDYGSTNSTKVESVNIEISGYRKKKGRIVNVDGSGLVFEPEDEFPAYVAPEEPVDE